MAYTQSDLDALDAAIAGGVTSVTMSGRTVTYRSMDELISARSHIAAQLNRASGQRGPRHSLADFSD